MIENHREIKTLQKQVLQNKSRYEHYQYADQENEYDLQQPMTARQFTDEEPLTLIKMEDLPEEENNFDAKLEDTFQPKDRQESFQPRELQDSFKPMENDNGLEIGESISG